MTRTGVSPLIELCRFRMLVDGLDHPEAVAYGPDGNLYAGGEAGQIYRVTFDGRVDQIADIGGFVLGLTLDAQGNVYACNSGHREVVRIGPRGAVTVLSKGTQDSPLRLPNYSTFDTAGRLYVTDSGEWGRANGNICRIDPDGNTHVVSREPCRFPNGLALSGNGRWLYVVESTLPGVSRLEVHDDATLGRIQRVVHLQGTVPDGIAFDAEGNLYIACYRPDRIYRYSVGGSLDILAEDPEGTMLNAPTNLAFAGPRLDHFVVANLAGWHLATSTIGVTGQPLACPDLGIRLA